ncbi:MAG: hypothetical protein Q4F34_03265 [Prevotellaceae bacterium]|nr:hypothetical protein [Prevotellaceae bacterium]
MPYRYGSSAYERLSLMSKRHSQKVMGRKDSQPLPVEVRMD